MIKAVFFDYGGTIYDFFPSNYQLLGQIARKYGKKIQDTDPILSLAFQKQEEYVFQIFKAEEPNMHLWHGANSTKEQWIECDKILLKTIGVSDPNAIDDLLYRFTERMYKFQIYPNTITTLDFLKQNGYKLGILSNINNQAKIPGRYQQLKEFGLFDLWDTIILSGEYDVHKPNPAIFQIALEKLPGILPEEVMYVGDSYIFDILGAKNAGWFPVLLDSNRGKTYNCEIIRNFSELIPLIEKINHNQKK